MEATEPKLTSSLVVTAAPQGSVVWYTIHPSASDTAQFTTFRFSELDEMHGRLSKEVPTFPGRLPPKTLKKNTKPNFIETRRKAIEVYLRLVSTDRMARASTAWHQFLGESVETTDVSVRAQSQNGVGATYSTVVTLVGLDFDKVNGDAGVKAALVTNIKDAFLTVMTGYTKDDLTVVLTKGSVKATVLITPKAGSNFAVLETLMTSQKAATESAVLKKVKAMTSVSSILENGKTLSDVTVVSAAEDSRQRKNATQKPASFRPDLIPTCDSEGEGPESFTSTVNCELRENLQSKRSNLLVARERKDSLEEELKINLDTAQSAQADAKEKAALECEAGARLRSHRASLAELDMQLSVRNMMAISQDRQQNEMTKRFLEEKQRELQMATEAKERAQKFFGLASTAVVEASTKAHSKVAAATAAKAEAEATLADTQESHAAMQVAMSVLQVRAKARFDDVNIAERELANLTSAMEVLDAESEDAGNLRQTTEVESKDADGAVAAHVEESACRARAHDLEIARATENAKDAATLRDIRTRALLMGVDRTSLEPAENASNVVAETAAEALAKATELADGSKSNDECQLQALQATAAMASKKLRKRETVVASFSARSMANKAAMEDASTKLAAASAPNNAIQERFATLRQQVETLAEALPECAAKLAEATKGLAAVAKENEIELLPLRHSEIVESQVLKERLTEEAALVKALAEAQIAAAEAAEVFASSMEGGSNLYLQVKSAETRLVDLDKAAQVAANGHKVVVEAIEVARIDLAAIDSSDDENPEEDDNDDNDDSDDEVLDSSAGLASSAGTEQAKEERKEERERSKEDRKRQKELAEETSKRKRVALWSKRGKAAKTKEKEAKIKALEKVLDDKENVAETAAAAAGEAREDLHSLRAQQTLKQEIEAMVKQEIDLVDLGITSRKDNEVAIVTEVKEKVAAWMVEQATLGANLHRAQLLAAAAEGDVSSNKNLAKSLNRTWN